MFDIAGGTLLATFAVGWTWSVATASARTDDATPVNTVTSRSPRAHDRRRPTTAFLTDAAMRALMPLRGESGRLQVQFREPGAPLGADSLPEGASVEYSANGATHAAPDDTAAVLAPDEPGVWRVAVKIGDGDPPALGLQRHHAEAVQREAARAHRSLLYRELAQRAGARASSLCAAPRLHRGDAENRDTYVSEHFRLGDFLTKDQFEVWPKYLVLETKLLDKLELVLADLQALGIRTEGVKVLSGFRTPQYNRRGGDPRGRAALSRHMYGDAADIYIDSDGNGAMDDLNGDGRVNIRDARVIQDAVERVERDHPQLIGGCGVYPGTGQPRTFHSHRHTGLSRPLGWHRR